MRRLLPVAAILLSAACAPAARAAACGPGSTDGDAAADLVVGRPAQAKVVVRQSLAGSVTLRGEASFGRAIAVGDLDGDACADVAVGQPDTNRVLVFRGSSTGVSAFTVPITLGPGEHSVDPFGPVAHEDFGTAVAIAEDTGLWVGAPGAGGVHHYRLDATGTVTEQADGGSTARPSAGERFGSVLAPGVNGVYVGVPKRSKGRGAVEQIRVGQPSRVFTLPHGRKGDAFGAALATSPSGARAYAGAPGRGNGRGVVQVLDGRRYSQDTKGVRGVARKGNRFGAALAAGALLGCRGAVAVGAPGDRSVTLVKGCRKRLTFKETTGAGRSLGSVGGALAVGLPGLDRVALEPKGRVAVPGAGRIVIASSP